VRFLLELAVVVTGVIFAGALIWTAFGMVGGGIMSIDQNARVDRAEGATRAMIVAAVALVLHIVARKIQKRRA